MQQGFRGEKKGLITWDRASGKLPDDVTARPDTSGLTRLEPETLTATNIDLSHSRQSACQV